MPPCWSWVNAGLLKVAVKAPHVVINGRVQGDVRAVESLELAAQARVSGALYYDYVRLEMALGAEVNGKLVCLTKEMLSKSLPAPVEFSARLAGGAEKIQAVDR